MKHPDFVAALEAVHLLSPHVGGDKPAKSAIVERLKDGAIRTRAWWSARGFDVGTPYTNPEIVWGNSLEERLVEMGYESIDEWRREGTRPQQSQSKVGPSIAEWVSPSPSVDLGPAFWANLSDGDLARWNWQTGFVLVSYETKPVFRGEVDRFPDLNYRWFALGVAFDRNDIFFIAGLEPGRSQKKTRRGPGRGPSNKTADFVAELFILDWEEDLKRHTPNKIIELISDRLAEKGVEPLGRTSAYPIVERVIDALHELGPQ